MTTYFHFITLKGTLNYSNVWLLESIHENKIAFKECKAQAVYDYDEYFVLPLKYFIILFLQIVIKEIFKRNWQFNWVKRRTHFYASFSLLYLVRCNCIFLFRTWHTLVFISKDAKHNIGDFFATMQNWIYNII